MARFISPRTRLITGIHLAHDKIPRTNFELEAEAMKVDGDDFFCAITFPVGETYATFVPGGWGGTVVGISSIDGLDAAENETATFMKFERTSGITSGCVSRGRKFSAS